MEDRVLQIGKILNLSSTPTRSKTVTSLIESILYSYNDELEFKDIVAFIDNIFGIKPFVNEIEESISNALIANEIISKNGKYSLNPEKYKEINKIDLKNKASEQNRFKKFNLLLESIILTYDKLQFDELKLWNVFKDYLYECFYQYGENAVNHFKVSDYIDSYDAFVDSSPFRNALNKLNTDQLKNTFKKVAILFIKNIDHEDIEYLESLSKKTISFHSLGLPKELHDEIIDLKVIDWTIYVDTNFLFSILNLHKNSENKACNDLLLLVQKHKLNIKFKYTPFTMGELKQRRSDFENNIPKSSLNQSHIKALINSGSLDSYSEAYYENLLNNSDSTLHPVDVIDLADKTVQSVKKIGLHNSRFTQLTEEYLNSKVVDYQRYIGILNDIYLEKGYKPISKSDKQLFHDVFLKEVIEFQQRVVSPDPPTTMSEIKVLGVTLDKLLIKYDKHTLAKRNVGFFIPNFHLPSFLLSKLYRLMPVQTDDYKKAFISAIATFSFSENSVDKSRTVQRFVNYYRDQGLQDEKLLLSFITDEFFLNKFFDEENNQDDFFESELNKKFDIVQSKFEEAEKKLELLENDKIATIEEKRENQSLISDQKSVIKQLEESEKVLLTEIKKIKKKPGKTKDDSQLSILDVIEENSTKKENKELKLQNESLIKKNKERAKKAYIDKVVRKWRVKSWVHLSVTILVFLSFFIYTLEKFDWSLPSFFTYIKSDYISAFLTFGSIVINYLLTKSLYDKYNSHSNIKAFKEQIDIPESIYDDIA